MASTDGTLGGSRPDWHAVVDGFEAAWQQGQRPQIASFVEGGSVSVHDDTRLLIELIHVELELRLKAGEPARVEEYLRNWPELADDPSIVIDLLQREIQFRSRGQPKPSCDEYAKRFPQWSERLNRLFEVHSEEGYGVSQDDNVVSIETSNCEDATAIISPSPEKADRSVSKVPRDSSSTSPRLTPGVQLGDYVLGEKLGEGGMGTVFKAEHRRMKRTVALKVLSGKLVDSPEAGHRFQREVETLARLKHPHIVTAHDAREDAGIFYFVMELVVGDDLARRVAQTGPLPVAEAIDCVLQAARGLEYAHQQGVIHRDVKPSNLLREETGSIKLLDLGLAHFEPLAGYADQPAMTGTNTIVGTVDYMSPEQAFCPKEVDRRSDVYSLGCTLYYLLTAQPMYPGRTPFEKLLGHKEQSIPKLRGLCPSAPVELEELFEKMVAKQPADRHSTMGEVIAELEKLQTEMGLSERISPRVSAPEKKTYVTLAPNQRKMNKLMRNATSNWNVLGGPGSWIGMSGAIVIVIATAWARPWASRETPNTQPSAIELSTAPPRVELAELHVQRKSDAKMIESRILVAEGREQETTSLSPLGADDRFVIFYRLSQPLVWTLVHVDPAGIAAVVARSKEPATEVRVPSKTGRGISFKRDDPKGINLLMLLTDDSSRGLTDEDLAQRITELHVGPQNLPPSWSHLRAGMQEDECAIQLPQDQVHEIKQALPPGVTPLHAMFLRTAE